MNLWVGLGNPGARYEKTRHNIGAILLKQIILDTPCSFDKSLNAYTGKKSINDHKYLYLFPQTFMNLSGDAVIKAMKMYKIEPCNIVVFHDEIELPPGNLCYKFGGGHRGHNGLRDIIHKIGTPDFHRIRIGVGRPLDQNMSVADYVLSTIPDDAMPEIPDLMKILEKEKLI